MDVRVTNELDQTQTIIQSVENILKARDKFARQKGYKKWGNMVAKHKQRSGSRPPYYFEQVN